MPSVPSCPGQAGWLEGGGVGCLPNAALVASVTIGMHEPVAEMQQWRPLLRCRRKCCRMFAYARWAQNKPQMCGDPGARW